MPETNGSQPAPRRESRWSALLLVAAVVGLGLGTAAQIVAGSDRNRWMGMVLLGLGAAAAVPGVVVASPWWQHRQAEALRRETDRRRHDLERRLRLEGPARGVAEAHWPGEFFTGRAAALRALAAWIRDDRGDPVKLVVGQPGSGKSAVLGRVGMLADPAADGTTTGADPQSV